MKPTRKTRPAPWLSMHPREPKAKPAKRIRSVSKHRAAEMAEYRKQARAYIRTAIAGGAHCVVVRAIPELANGRRYGCKISDKLNEIHHRRGRVGALLLDQRFWMPISKAGHKWVHSNPEESRKRGWLCELGQWNKPVPPINGVDSTPSNPLEYRHD